MKIKDLARENIWNLKPYSSARDEFSGSVKIQLDANENPFDNGLNRYPDPYQNELKSVLSEIKGVEIKNMILGNGSDELIDMLIRSFCEPRIDNILTVRPSYGMYKVSAAINDVELVEVDLNADFSLNVKALLEKVNSNTKLLMLCSPNNPSGNLLEVSAIEELLNSFNGLVVIDEAYIDFSKEISWSKRLSEYPQLVVLQTLSKFYGLASLRVGIGYASEEIVGLLNKVKPPYNVNGLSQESAIERIKNQKERNRLLESILNERTRLNQFLKASKLVQTVLPSDTNFLLVKFTDAERVYIALKDLGIVVRNRSNEPLCNNCLRITIGTPAENQELMNQLKRLK